MNRCVVFLGLLMSATTACALFDLYRAHELYHTGEIEQAEKVLQRLTINNPADWKPLFDLGTIALNHERFDEAIVHFEKVLQIDPTNQEARERLEAARKKRDEKQQQEQEKQKQNEQNKKDQNKQNNDQRDNDNSSQKQGQDQNQKQDQSQQQSQQPQQKQKSDQRKQDESDVSQQENKREQKKEESGTDNSAAQQQPNKQEQQNLAQDKRFSEQEKQLLQALEKVDKDVQKKMTQYAVAQRMPRNPRGEKNW